MKEYLKPEVELVQFTTESITDADLGTEEAPSGW